MPQNLAIFKIIISSPLCFWHKPLHLLFLGLFTRPLQKKKGQQPTHETAYISTAATTQPTTLHHVLVTLLARFSVPLFHSSHRMRGWKSSTMDPTHPRTSMECWSTRYRYHHHHHHTVSTILSRGSSEQVSLGLVSSSVCSHHHVRSFGACWQGGSVTGWIPLHPFQNTRRWYSRIVLTGKTQELYHGKCSVTLLFLP